MAQLVVRNIDDTVVRALRVQAAAHGHSMEAEHRLILRRSLLGENGDTQIFKELLAEMPDVGSDDDFQRVQDFGRELDLSD